MKRRTTTTFKVARGSRRLPLSLDRKLARERGLPDNFSKHHEWTTSDVPGGENKYQKKRIKK